MTEDVQPKPIEVVHVIPNEFTVNQMGNVLGTFAVNTFLGPLIFRALLRNFGVELPYWKAVRTLFAVRAVAHMVMPDGYKFPAAKGKDFRKAFEARLERKQETPEQMLNRLIKQARERRGEQG